MKKAIFLDRDGVINKDNQCYVLKSSDLQLLENVPEALKQLKGKGFLLIGVSNQGAIGKNLATEEEVNILNSELNKQITSKGGHPIDKFFFCPHHPNAVIEKYKMDCSCRKPRSGMILSAAKEFDIDLKSSFMIGDRISDIVAGKKAGCKTILIESPVSREKIAGPDYDMNEKPDFFAKNLYDALNFIS